MNKLRAWYSGLQPREQRMVAAGSVVVAVLILGALLMSLQSAVSHVAHRNDSKREDLAWMQANAAELRATDSLLPAATGEAPVVIVDRAGREAGLTDSLRGTQPNGTGVRVQLEGASFDAMVLWIATLDERYGLALESITVDRTAKPGLVNASITFSQPQH